MLRTIFRISLRNLLKHKVYSLINISGLALGFTAFILIGLFVQYEVSWDKINKNYDRIYRIQRHYSKTMYAMNGNDISPHSRAVTAQLLEKSFPEFEKVTVIRENGQKFLASDPDKQVYETKGIAADSCYFDVFTYHFTEGNPKTALIAPYSIVLSKAMAEKLFKDEPALGKRVSVEKKVDMTVTGVYEDLPENTSMRPNYIISFSSLAPIAGITRHDIWTGDCMTFALMKRNVNYKSVESKIRNVFKGFNGVEYEELQLCPMKKIYLNFNNQGDYLMVLALYGLVGVFILLMSSFNYINLTTANASIRGKEIAVKKVSGSKRSTLIVQFISETVAISLVSFMLALLLAKLSLPVYSMITGKQLGIDLTGNLQFFGLMVIIALCVGLLSGIYPALFLSSNKIVMLLKGQTFSGRNENFSLKKALVTLQFAISVFLILITFSFSLNIKYLTKKDLGFNKENMLYAKMTVTKDGKTFSQLREKILQHPEIQDGSMSRHVPFVTFGGGMTNWEGGNPDDKVSCRFNEVSYDFVKNMGISVIAGRDFSRDFPGDIGKACLINETAAKCFGWNDPIGKRVSDNRYTVVGVLRNYIYKDMHNGIEPAILILAPEEIGGDWTFAFRIDPRKFNEAKNILTQEFEAAFSNDPFEFMDLPSAFASEHSYKTYHAVNRTIMFFTIFNIFLAIIGLLGLVSFTVLRRTKEIGVRKINGSSSLDIFFLLNREYFILLAYALLIAVPGAWWAYEKIPGANKIPAKPWIFILGAGVIFIIILLTTSYQTVKAAIRNPVEALRYE